ncbi:MAG: response regulator [Sulfitobacter sp.]
MKILVVDDDPVILEILQVVLRQEGHEKVVVAQSGVAALDILARDDERFDVLVLDIAMPGMDGVALCSAIRKLAPYTRTPIIMLTAKSDGRSIESAFGAGANDYITKPFDIKGIGFRLQVAERMMTESRVTLNIKERHSELGDVEGMHGFEIDGSVCLQGVKQHTDEFSLGNYLSTMEKYRVDETSVFAAQIRSFDILYRTCTGQELAVILTEVWNSIASAADNSRLLGTYVGSGTFILITACTIQEDWLGLEPMIGESLAGSVSLKQASFGCPVKVALGRPFRPNASKTKRVKPTFDRARQLLQKRLEMDAASG